MKHFISIKDIFLSVFMSLVNIVYSQPESIPVSLRGELFNVELADSRQERKTGLMFREHLKDNEGMLFKFDKEAIYPVWMKNVLIELDIIWIDKDKKVVFIKESAQPHKKGPHPSIRPTKKALYILEVNAGTVGRTALTIGDEVDFALSQRKEER